MSETDTFSNGFHVVGKLPMETQCFINGEFVMGGGDNWKNLNPSTEEILSINKEASHDDVDKAVEAATIAFETWQKTSGKTKRNLLYKLAELIEKHSEQLAYVESLDNGKPVTVAKAADLKLVVDCYKYYAGWADKMQGKTIPIESLGEGDQSYLCFTKHEPIGVVAQIIPWNFPLLMMAWKIAPAIAAGCCIVMKTSEKTPLTGQMVCHLIKEAGFPNGVINVLTGYGPTVGDYLVRHPGITKVAFTGSTAIGKKIMMASAETDLKKVTLELGGKSPLIVLDDADIEKAIQTAQIGLFFNQGQCCVASSRIFVQETIYDEFVEKAVAMAKNVEMSSPQSQTCTQGPQVDAIQYKKILQYIESGKSQGADMMTGGKNPKDKGYYIEPTVFANVSDDMTIAKEEIFGPVMSIMKFKTLEEALKRANNTKYGLGAGICTNNFAKAMKIAHQLKAGTIYINCYDVFDSAAPFGGFKQSGIGRELGEYALQNYYEVKTIIHAL